MKLKALGVALLLGAATLSHAQEAPKPSPFTFALHGFVSVSGASQSGAFVISEGQQSLASATGVSPVNDKNSFTADVRQTRLNFSVTGPKVLFGATPTGVVEVDFFNGQGAGNYGDVSIIPRLRVGYSELNWGMHKLQLGQQNDLVFAMAPTSLSHIAFPLGYFTGNIGWRRPGIFGFHTFQLSNDLKVEGAWEIGRSQWADASNGGAAGVTIGGAAANTPGGINLGEASGAPALEGRVSATYSKFLFAFVGAHWNQVDLTGYGQGIALPAGSKHSVDTAAYNAGLKLTLPLPSDMLLTVAGTGFTGKNVAPLIANMTTAAQAFRVGPLGEDVNTMGWWAQAGFNLTKEFSVWAFYGNQAIDKKDFVRAAQTQAAAAPSGYENATTNIELIYRDGNYGLSAEWIEFNTKYTTAIDVATLSITGNRTAKSDQYMISANYFF